MMEKIGLEVRGRNISGWERKSRKKEKKIWIEESNMEEIKEITRLELIKKRGTRRREP